MFKRFFLSCLLFLACASVSASEAPSPADHSDIQFSDIDYSYHPDSEEESCCGTLTVLGKATNTGHRKLDHAVFEARFFDASGKLIDAFNDSTFSLGLLPGQEIMVRISDQARYAPDRYASAQIRLASGKFENVEPPSDSTCHSGIPAILIQLFMSWGPILMLIGVWLWLIKRSNASNYQNRLIDLMKEQNQTLERQAAAIEKIAQMQETQNLRN